jgi:hypothetical protein
MPRVGFELTIPAFERAKAVHALGRAVTVMGRGTTYTCINKACRGIHKCLLYCSQEKKSSETTPSTHPRAVNAYPSLVPLQL